MCGGTARGLPSLGVSLAGGLARAPTGHQLSTSNFLIYRTSAARIELNDYSQATELGRANSQASSLDDRHMSRQTKLVFGHWW